MKTILIIMMIFCARDSEIKSPVKKQTIEQSCQEIRDALDGYSISEEFNDVI